MALSAYQRFTKEFFASNPGASMTEAAAAWRGGGGARGGGGGGKICESTIVPLPDGSGVSTRAQARLNASFEGHVPVQFNQGALGAVWSGLVERMRSDGAANLAALFPDLYPQAAAVMRADRGHADEREIGRQLAPLLGAALVAYRVTPEEWAAWYTNAVEKPFVIPQANAVCVRVGPAVGPPMWGADAAAAALPGAAQDQAAQFGGVLGAPGGAFGGGTSGGAGAGSSYGAFGAVR